MSPRPSPSSPIFGRALPSASLVIRLPVVRALIRGADALIEDALTGPHNA